MSGKEGAAIDLYWLPLGAGGRSVRWNGRIFELAVARHEHRFTRDLYHSALQVQIGQDRFVIEMTPAWGNSAAERGVTGQGAVGALWLGRSRCFRYEIRCWRNGVIPDVQEAVDSPRRLSEDPGRASRLIELVPLVPIVTWGRDELRTGEMWDSNSLIAWLIASAGIDPGAVHPPANGRAPGWFAGLMVATR